MIARVKIDLATAIKSLEPEAQFAIDGEKDITWLSPDLPQPSMEDILSERDRLQLIVDADYAEATKPYRIKRKKAYPSIADQLDLLFHSGYDGWKAAIQAIKDQYPKEGE